MFTCDGDRKNPEVQIREFETRERGLEDLAKRETA
jgi:hypothetical protein